MLHMIRSCKTGPLSFDIGARRAFSGLSGNRRSGTRIHDKRVQTRSVFFHNGSCGRMAFSRLGPIVVQDLDAGAPAPMDAAKHDPVAMIAELARAMKPERRGRFLDAACGGDARLRAEVEATARPRRRREWERAGGGGRPARPAEDLVPGSVESIALDALNEAPAAGAAESQAEPPGDLPIDAYCDRHRLDLVARLRLFQQVCRAIDHDHQRGLIHGGLTTRHVRVSPDGTDSFDLARTGGRPGRRPGRLALRQPGAGAGRAGHDGLGRLRPGRAALRAPHRPFSLPRLVGESR